MERFQGTALHQRYRMAYRYRYYTDAATIDADLQAWLGQYNDERPHRGYRLAGRRPADVFHSTRPDLPIAKGWTDEPTHPSPLSGLNGRRASRG